MSILIKGMEMPKSGTYICIIENNTIWLTNNDNVVKFMKGEICEVPTPHGRLIDEEWLFRFIDTNNSLGATHYGCLTKEEISEAPTVVESEE